MKSLLIVTALLEAVTGVAPVMSPAPPVLLRVGAAFDTTGGLVVARDDGRKTSPLNPT